MRSAVFAAAAALTAFVAGSGAAPVDRGEQRPAASAAAPSSDNRITRADYTAAAPFAPARLQKLVGTIQVKPVWLKHSDRFWYESFTGEGRAFYLADPARGTKTALFDTEAIAAQLATVMHDAFDARNLPLEKIRFIDGDRKVRFEVKSSQIDEAAKAADEARAKARDEERVRQGRKKRSGKEEEEARKKKDYKKVFAFEYDLASGRLEHLSAFKKLEDDPKWANFSPDEQTVVYGKGYDLYWMDRENYEKARADEEDKTVVEHRLTEDGQAFYDYFGEPYVNRVKSDDDPQDVTEKRVPAHVVWSHDSSRFALIRYDRRKTDKLWVIDSLAKPRPTLQTYSYPMPGDQNVDQNELWVFDMPAGAKRQVDLAAFKDQYLDLLEAPEPKRNRGDERHPARWLSTRADTVYLYRASRDLKRIDLLEVDLGGQQTKVLAEERFNTPNDQIRENKAPWVLAGGKELIFWSERNGWAHFYLYDNQGRVKNAVTQGNFHVDTIEGVDEKARVLYFSAFGRERGQNPYYRHLYRVNLDGSGLRVLNGANFDHRADVCDSTRYFVDNYSRVDSVPRFDVRDSSGKTVLELGEADLTQLQGAGYKFPEPFAVKADDGVTDLYGVMYKPFKFDPAKRYPIIAYVYPGPQTEGVDPSFLISRDTPDYMPPMQLPALAQFGYIVVTVGNRGGHPHRSRAYQDFSYHASFRDYGLADKKAAIEQLAARHEFIDIDRVGIFGHSGGGFMSTAAMLVYPDFFKVAVSSAGNHENSIYNQWWNERFNGVDEVKDDKGAVTFKHSVTENAELAKNLKGHLLLVTGGVDDNVHPANTFRVVEALILAGKRFDMLVIPSGSHGFPGAVGEYFFWARADYFNRYLLGDAPTSIDMINVIREHPAGK